MKEIKNFSRKSIFDHYNSCDNPFLFLTIKVNVTNIVEYCKINKNFYATMGFIVTKVVNKIEQFKYRYKDGKIYYFDEIRSNYTQMYNDGNIGYFSLPYSTMNYTDYLKLFVKTQNEFLNKNSYTVTNNLDEIWLSCAPWFSFTSLITPYTKSIAIPQFTWDKYVCENDKYYINLAIMVHHGFVDGSHIGKFVKLLEEEIADFNR